MYRWALDETSGTTAAETGKHGGDSVPATLVAGAIFTGVDLAAGKWGGGSSPGPATLRELRLIAAVPDGEGVAATLGPNSRIAAD